MSETPPKSGRYGTFDNRYRYDHIYPRGRSGETLRAWDIQDSERPVVIKRPAPQDAPPMRAAQEVSIRNERKALERLAGHAVLTELRGTGTFRVGGQTHEYIVMDRAEGQIIGDMVLELAERGERLPMLEMLVIVDQLLDLLILAHEQQVVYNDVDAKHLFWSRDVYRLKIIDWGNAVLLDEGGSQGITRQSDVYQVGELLYYIVSGGKRLDSETAPDGEHAVIFGMDAAHVPSALQSAITRATHPNLRKRYTTLIELRHHLTEIRKPLADRRDNILSEVRRELSSNNSHEQLATLMERIEKALALDPGYPESHRLRETIESEQHRLETQAQIDAARIYLDTANWPRAIETMLDLLESAGPQMAPVIRFIIAAAELLDTRERTQAPPALGQAIDELLRGDAQEAGVILTTADSNEDSSLLAERLVAMIPAVLLLRPPLLRIRAESMVLPNDTDVRGALDRIESLLEGHADVHDLAGGLQTYRDVGAELENLSILLEGAGSVGERLVEIVARSQQALSAILTQLQTVSGSVYSEPGRAGDALRRASRIDPQNSYFNTLNEYLEEVHLAVTALSSFKPKLDGADLGDWLNRVLNLLAPYGDDIKDQRFQQALDALQSSASLWVETLDGFILGQRLAVKSNLARIAKLMEPLNRNIAQWGNEFSEKAANATHVEQLSPKTALAQILMDGYKVWDQGKLNQVPELAEKAKKQAATPGEKQAVERLAKLAQIPATWLKASGSSSYELTDQAERDLVALFLPAENAELTGFTEQMPTENAYLKTMGRGIVDYMRQSSTAAVRILFLHYTWRGLLSVQQNELNSAEFWREAALKTMAEGRSNPVFAEFDTLLTGRKLVLEAEAALNKIQSPKDLASVRTLLNQPLADQWLADSQRAIRQMEQGIRHWEDGDFRAAREALEIALNELDAGEKRAKINLSKLRAWVKPLHEGAMALQTSRLKLEEIAHSTRIPAPGEDVAVNPTIEQVLESIVETTEKRLGSDYAHQLKQWLSSYRAVLETHTDASLDRTAKLVAYQAHFAGLFINRHPTYRLFQVWREAAQNMPDAVQAEAATPSTYGNEAVAERRSSIPAIPPVEQPDFVEAEADAGDESADDSVFYEESRSNIPWGTLIAIAIVIIGVLAFALLGGLGDDDGQGGDNNGGSVASVTDEGSADTPTNEALINPTTAVAINPPASATATTRSDTATPDTSPTATLTTTTPPPTDTPSPVPTTPVPTIEPTTAVPTESGPFGNLPVNVLRTLEPLLQQDYDWNPLWFGPGAGDPWGLGGPEIAGAGPIVVKMSPGFLAGLFGVQAAERLIAIEADLELVVPDQPEATISFGVGIENAAGQRVSAEIRVNETNVISWGITENTGYRERSAFPSSDRSVNIRLERNTSGTISLYIDNQFLGESNPRYGERLPLTPVLYTSGGGIYVVVSRLQYEFGPVQ